jgi:hypothetical protein
VRRRRALAVGVLAVLLGIVVAVVLGGGSTNRHPRAVRSAATVERAPRLVVAGEGELPSARQDAAMAPDGSAGGVLLVGGLDSEEASLAQVLSISGSRVAEAGSLSTPTHDACASEVGGVVYLFGGGEQSSFSTILRVSTTGTAVQVGSLPTPASDVACVTVGGTVYVIGGNTGEQPLRTIVAWQPGRSPRVVAELPKPLRYAAAGEVDGRLLIAGGTSGVQASRDIYSFDPEDGTVNSIGQLPYGVTHAAGAPLGGSLLVIGGRGAGAGTQHSGILAVSPSGTVVAAGRLPQGLSDVSAAAVEGHVIVAGGVDRRGQLQSALMRVSAAG